MAVIVIDPGHGGTRTVGGSSPNNATGPRGTLEKNLTLDLAIRMRTALSATPHTVILTRSTDVNLGLRDRAAVARANRAAAFVSIHFNGDANPTIQGTETWVHSRASSNSYLLARHVQQRMTAATGYRDRGVKSKILGVLDPQSHSRDTAVCLAEVSFMSDPADELRLQNNGYRDQLGAALTRGVLDFVELASPRALVSETALVSDLAFSEAAVTPPEELDGGGVTALDLAVEGGHWEALQVLVRPADGPGWAPASLNTALLSASSQAPAEIVRLLLDSGAEIDARDERGWTALMTAAASGNSAAVQALLEAGADAKATAATGEDI